MSRKIYIGNNKVAYRDEKDKFNIQDSFFNFEYEFKKVYITELTSNSKDTLNVMYKYLGEFQSPDKFIEKYPEMFI